MVVLFGLSMLILIGGSFWWVMQHTQELARSNTREKASELLSSAFLRIHIAGMSNPDFELLSKQFFEEFSDNFKPLKHETTTLVFSDDVRLDDTRPTVITNPEVENELEPFAAKFAAIQREELI
ncbi:MAG: hypothetical protein GTO41_18035, partial [Burkholderiales bacterium]|nr:hypothetical protein [Burkholderiales bacterium]